MPAHLFFPDGRRTPVKNLGWLLKHWKDVDYFRVTDLPHGRGLLQAVLRRQKPWLPTSYVCEWESLSHCLEWLHRPVFRTMPIVRQAPEHITIFPA